MNTKRLLLGILAGAILGVFCIIGASVRSGFAHEADYLFAFWYNRVIIGMAIGLAAPLSELRKVLLRGAIIGTAVSFAFLSSTGYGDLTGFFAGVVYGVIIDFVLFKTKMLQNK